jgi:hypothetical protein
MKKALVLAILGVATVASTFGQGHINVWNYGVSPYNQVFWGAGQGPTGNQAVTQTTVQLQIWYGAGVVTDASTLLPGVIFSVNPGTAFNPGSGHGPGGYYDPQTQVVPTVGTYTFQIRASGTGPGGVIDTAASRSALWQPTGIVSTGLPANLDPNSIGLAVFVPEPSTFALAGLGSAALLIFRRRK